MRLIRKGALRALVLAIGVAALTLPAAAAAEDALVVENSTNSWLVELKGSAASFRAEAKAANINYTERAAFSELWNGVSINADASVVGALEALPSVATVYPNATLSLPPYQPDLNFAGGLTGADLVKSNLGFDGSGVRVAVMDTGIDYHHPDLGGCFGPGCRVETGWDFVGDAFNVSDPAFPINPVPNPDPDPDDCNGHGSHVSGIVGANGRIDGVAPGVTFGAYRVFGCEGNTSSDVMIAAMERVLRDKMDVLNMSIGSANVNWPNAPTAKAASELARRGVKVVASIGNSGPVNLYSAGAPGVGERVIGVASFDNTLAEMYAFLVSPDNLAVPWGAAAGTTSVPPLSGSGEIVTTTPANACAAVPTDIAVLPSLAGKIALIQRGVCGFYNKALAAQRAGAVAVVLYNNAPGRLTPTVAPVPPHTELVTIPVAFITQAMGTTIAGRIATSPPVTITWTNQFTTEAVPTAGTMSSFSSWGLAADLSVKPDIGAPGGNILSTYPLQKNGYANISGTSMSSPHVAGAVALLLDAKGTNVDAETVRTILQNSADPRLVFGLISGQQVRDAVQRQGAGMLDIDDAIQATTYISPGKLSLGEDNGQPQTRTLTIRNNGPTAMTYSLSHLDAAATSNNTFAAAPYLLPASSATFSPSSVNIAAGGSATVDVTITASAGLTDRSMYSGYVLVAGSDGSQFSVPYAGFKGDYQSIEILTPLMSLGGRPGVLARPTATGGFAPIVTPGAVFTLAGATQIPSILVHFHHQVQKLEVEVRNSAGQKVHPVFSNGIEDEFLPRNSTATGLFVFQWDGNRSHDSGNGNGDHRKVVSDGTYTLTLKALKALGDPANPAHWETFTTVPFVVDRP
jgi:minor extracellular serine protease Vpr